VPSGVMDQMASSSAREGHALLLDCRTLEVEHVPVREEIGVVVVHSGVPRSLEGTGYADRADATRELAVSLGLRSLRDATPDDVADHPLGRHVVGESARVEEAARALADGDGARLGELFAASHASLRDDYGVSTPELDALVAALVEAGAHGARLTGAGFGGAVVAVCERGAERSVGDRAAAAYREAAGREPTVFAVRPAGGAGPLAS
jgi:galactokinase